MLCENKKIFSNLCLEIDLLKIYVTFNYLTTYIISSLLLSQHTDIATETVTDHLLRRGEKEF